MDIKKEKFIAYCAVAALFVIGVVCYAAFPDKKPEVPVRIMLDTAPNATQKKVLFTHKEHNTRKNYGIDCIDCHHKWVKAPDGKILYLRNDDTTGENPVACSNCHPAEKAEGDNPKQPKLADAFHQRCGGCHDEAGHGPASQDCSGCHVN